MYLIFNFTFRRSVRKDMSNHGEQKNVVFHKPGVSETNGEEVDMLASLKAVKINASDTFGLSQF